MSEPRRKRLLDWKAALGITISVAALYWVLRKQNFGDILAKVGEADPIYFTLAAICATGVFWFRAWRWKCLLESVRDDVPFRSRFAAIMIGFMGNNIFPARAGEFMRAYALSHEERIPVGVSVASLAIERLLDGLTILAMLLVGLAFLHVPQNTDSALIVAKLHKFAIVIGVVFVGLLFFVLAPGKALQLTQRCVRILPARMRDPVFHTAHAFTVGLRGLRDPGVLARALAWSIALWLFNALGFYWALHAFDLPVTFMQAVFFQCAIVVAVAPPGAPGFWGMYELGANLVLVGLWQFDAATSTAFAISYHIAGYIPVTLIGLYYAWRLGVSRRAAVEEVAEVDDEELDHVAERPAT